MKSTQSDGDIKENHDNNTSLILNNNSTTIFSSENFEKRQKKIKYPSVRKIVNSYNFFKNSYTYQKKEKIFTQLFDSDFHQIQNKNIKLFSFDENFEFIPLNSRKLVFDDLYEFDRCFYQKNFNIDLEENLNKNKKKTIISNINNKLSQIKNDYNLSSWKTEIIEKILKSKNKKNLKTKIIKQITKKGFPKNYRPLLWRFLIKNDLKITKNLFKIHLKTAIENYTPNTLIKKDLDRTFSFYKKSQEFSLICKEAIILLNMFEIYRPDLKYIQGMSYIIVMLLLIFPPYSAFKYFCNLIIGKSLLYKLFSFEKIFIDRINFMVESIFKKSCKKLYTFLKINNLEIWNIFWVEFVFALFMKNFDSKTSIVLWDLFLLKEEFVIFKLNRIIFLIIKENLRFVRKDTFLEDVKKLMISKREVILYNLFKEEDFDYYIMDLLNI